MGGKIVKLVIQRAASRVAPHNAGSFKAMCWQRFSCVLQRANAKAVLERIQFSVEEEDGVLDAIAC